MVCRVWQARVCPSQCSWQKDSLVLPSLPCAHTHLSSGVTPCFLLFFPSTSTVWLPVEVEQESLGCAAGFAVVTHHVTPGQDFPSVPISLEPTDGHVLLLEHPPSWKQLGKREEELLEGTQGTNKRELNSAPEEQAAGSRFSSVGLSWVDVEGIRGGLPAGSGESDDGVFPQLHNKREET